MNLFKSRGLFFLVKSDSIVMFLLNICRRVNFSYKVGMELLFWEAWFVGMFIWLAKVTLIKV